MTYWGRQMIRHLRHWVPDRFLVVVADSRSAVLELRACVAGLRQPVSVTTRLRLDAALYDPTPESEAGLYGRPRFKGARQPTLGKPPRRSQDHLGDSHRGMVRWANADA